MDIGQILSRPLVTSDSLDGTSAVLQRYLRAFADDTSTVIAAPARVAALADEPAFAGWSVTDCSERFVAGAGSAVATDELVLESSGTTGDPKLVRYRKQVIRNCARAIGERLELDPDRDYLSLVNPRFAYGLSIVHSHALAAVPVRLERAPSSLDAWARIRRKLRPGSVIYLAPHHSVLFAQDPTWRFDAPIDLVFAGSPLRTSMVDVLRTCFPLATVTNMYGQAELGPRISIGRCAIDDFHDGAVGHPLPGVRVRALPGTGAIAVCSPFRMAGYLTASGEPLAGTPADEWWPTGDIGRVDADGAVTITGRAAADINFLGTRLDPEHLRGIVRGVTGVLEARVSVIAHDAFGQCPRIRVLIPSPDDAEHTERAVRIALSDSIGKAAAAVVVDLVDPSALPDSGKL